MKISTRTIARVGVSAALYVVSTLLCAPLAYGQVQFRFSEMMMLLCFFSKDYVVSMTLGCLIVNMFSPLGLTDVFFGTSATLVAAVLIYLTRNGVIFIVAGQFTQFMISQVTGMATENHVCAIFLFPYGAGMP